MKSQAVITSAIFEAFLHCDTKAYLLDTGISESSSEVGKWRQALAEQFEMAASERLRLSVSEAELHVGMPLVSALKRGLYRVVVDPVIELPDMRAQPHALERRCSDQAAATSVTYSPVHFLPGEKITASDKLLVAFGALAVGRLMGRMPSVGKIIHGSNHRATTFQLPKLLGTARSIITKIAAQRANVSPPPLILNKHCPECAFQQRCRQIAVEKDDLSLLPTMQEQERKRQNEKGIFTINQLSYTYRPRRYSARTTSPNPKHDPALKALAIRTNRIHVIGTPHFDLPSDRVFIDVEGVPDRAFYYLVGLRYRCGDKDIHCSFWADDDVDERSMWLLCLGALRKIGRPRLLHYGSYETKFLKHMRDRYCDNEEDGSFIEELISSSFNLLSLVYGNIYFPTYSNGLKEIARYLGFQWSEATASGLSALIWRAKWEDSRQPHLLQKLLTYNAEDCEAAQRLAEAMAGICAEQPTTPSQTDSVNVASLEWDNRCRFRALQYALPDFKPINKAAYWDYQRSKVYARSGACRTRTSQATRKKARKIPINKTEQAAEKRPELCLRCNSKRLYINGHYSHVVYDLRFSSAGIRRFVVRRKFMRYQCWSCKKGYNELPRQDIFGKDLKAYVVYQIIELRIPQRTIACSLNRLFGFQMTPTSIKSIKVNSSKKYEASYQNVIHKIVASPVVHADETRVMIGNESHYVWVFTSLNHVAYVYSSSRSSDTAQEILRDFKGVLVSDFYAGYDAIDCPQQKCLIHLLRDLNDDVLKQPFNEEMVEVALSFAALLRPMVETVDRFGLKARYLRKHKKIVQQFYRNLSKRGYKTEVAMGYKKRFEKNRAKLFTFLDYDDVSWNNNNAEHAVKAFVQLRRIIRSNSTVSGIKQYLILLTLGETCKYKDIDFLSFLRSGEMDVDAFIGRP